MLVISNYIKDTYYHQVCFLSPLTTFYEGRQAIYQHIAINGHITNVIFTDPKLLKNRSEIRECLTKMT